MHIFCPGRFWFKCSSLQWSLAFFKQRAVLHQEMVIKVTCSTACEITALQLNRHIPGNWFYGYIKLQKVQLYSIMTENYRQGSTAASSYTLLRIKKKKSSCQCIVLAPEGFPFSPQISSSWNINISATLSIHPLNPHVLPSLLDHPLTGITPLVSFDALVLLAPAIPNAAAAAAPLDGKVGAANPARRLKIPQQRLSLRTFPSCFDICVTFRGLLLTQRCSSPPAKPFRWEELSIPHWHLPQNGTFN